MNRLVFASDGPHALGTVELGCRVMWAWSVRGFKG
jgi:hypothetical protein